MGEIEQAAGGNGLAVDDDPSSGENMKYRRGLVCLLSVSLHRRGPDGARYALRQWASKSIPVTPEIKLAGDLGNHSFYARETHQGPTTDYFVTSEYRKIGSKHCSIACGGGKQHVLSGMVLVMTLAILVLG